MFSKAFRSLTVSVSIARRLRNPDTSLQVKHLAHYSYSGDEQQDRTLENKRSTPQASSYGQGVMAVVDSLMSSTGPPPKDKYQQLKEEYNRIQDKLRQSHATIDNYERDLRKTKRELRKAYECIGDLQRQLEDAKTLSEAREKKLFGAQDTLSISEVGEKVAALNEEIFQTAAALGEALIHKRHKEVSQRELDAAAAVSREMVGEKMTNILITRSQNPEPEVNLLLVQVVLQIFMVKFCISKIQSWYPSDSAIGETLSVIYSKIRSNEEQEVSGRWRALTRSNIRSSSETWEKELLQKLQSLLVLASLTVRFPKDEESYVDRLPSIFKAINELRMAIGENFTSSDLDVFVFECDKIYDPGNMDDAYGDGRQSSGKRAPEAIVGTTGIGLGKILKERSARGFLQVQTLIPAKIVLTSTMKEALEQPTRVKKKRPVANTDGANQDGRD